MRKLCRRYFIKLGKFVVLYCRCICLLFFFMGSQPLSAGVLFSPGLEVTSYSFAPLHEENTPNYYALGPAVTLGYSLNQMIDFGFFANYLPGAVKKIGVGDEDAFIYNLGVELGGTFINQNVKFKLKGSEQRYRGLNTAIENHVEGFWRGRAYGFATLGVIPINREFFMEIGLEVMRSSLTQDSLDPNKEKRALTYFSAIIGFTFNDFKPSFIETRLFKGII